MAKHFDKIRSAITFHRISGSSPFCNRKHANRILLSNIYNTRNIQSELLNIFQKFFLSFEKIAFSHNSRQNSQIGLKTRCVAHLFISIAMATFFTYLWSLYDEPTPVYIQSCITKNPYFEVSRFLKAPAPARSRLSNFFCGSRPNRS